MSSQEIINQLPFFLSHPIITIVICFMVGAIAALLLDLTVNDKISKGQDVIGVLSGLVMIGSIVGLIVVLVAPEMLTTRQINLIREAPIEVTKTQTIDLVSARSAGFADTTVNGGMWSISGTTNDTTSYRYIIKNGDSYQIKTLHDQFGDVNTNDVSIKQESGRKQAQLVVENKQYKDNNIRRLISMTSWSPKWQTFTFKVGDGAISSNSDFK